MLCVWMLFCCGFVMKDEAASDFEDGAPQQPKMHDWLSMELMTVINGSWDPQLLLYVLDNNE